MSRWSKYMPRASVKVSMQTRFEYYVEPEPMSGCWLWIGSGNGGQKPYGRLFDLATGKNELAHRVSYRLFKGEIPAGFQIDHCCRNMQCVNPNHLEAVTMEENKRRRWLPPHCSTCQCKAG